MLRKKKLWIILGSSLLLLCLLAFATYRVITSRTFQFFGHITSRVETTDKVVALTFDDGPSGRTGTILSILDSTGITATFYLTGNELDAHPELGDLIAQSGHEIGNHTYSHQRNVFKSARFLTYEIKQTNALIRQTGYDGPVTFRPPYGKKFILLPYILRRNSMETVTWDMEPDSFCHTPDDIERYTLDNVKPGSVILLHPMHNQASADALQGVITGLTAQGYRFVTVSELLAMKG